jgi:hypothetical protein
MRRPPRESRLQLREWRLADGSPGGAAVDDDQRALPTPGGGDVDRDAKLIGEGEVREQLAARRAGREGRRGQRRLLSR